MSSAVKTPTQAIRQGRPLRGTLLILFAALVFVPILFVSLITIQRQRAQETASVAAQLNTVAGAQQLAIERWVAEIDTTMVDSVRDPGLVSTYFLLAARVNPEPISGERGNRGFDEVEAVFGDFGRRVIATTDGRIDRVVLTNAAGLIVGASEEDLIARDSSVEPWYLQAISMPDADTSIIVGPIADPIDGNPSYYFSVPVVDLQSGSAVGVLTGRVRTIRLNAIITPLAALGESGEILIVRDGHQFVNTPRFGEATTVASDPVVDLALAGESGADLWIDYRNVPVIGVYQPIPELNLGLIVKQDISEALGSLALLALFNLIPALLIGSIVFALGWWFVRRAIHSMDTLGEIFTRVSLGEQNVEARETGFTELDVMSRSFNRLMRRLQTLTQSQEQTIKERTRQLEITTQMGHVISAETDLDRLMQLTIDMVKDQLNYYHAQVFLVDDLRQYAVLRASTGDVGRQLLARGHKLPVGSQSVIGQVTQTGESVLARDADESPIHRRNELLPDTRAELATPLRIGDQIIGALDIQSARPDTFDEDTISVLQTVADQLAVAIRNAQLFQEKEGLLSASLQLTQMLTRDNWNSYADKRGEDRIGFTYDLSEIKPYGSSPLAAEAPDPREINLPIALRGEVIGKLKAALPGDQPWTDQERQMVEAVIDRMALALDNARLFEQTQSSLAETHRLYEASQSIAEADSVQSLARRLLEFSALDVLDRAQLLILDDPDHAPAERWASLLAYWARGEGLVLPDVPQRLHTGELPLLTIEETPNDGIIFQDVESAAIDAEVQNYLQRDGVLSRAIYPLVAGRRVLAWLVLDSMTRRNAFHEADLRFFNTLTDQAAVALESLRLLEQTNARARRLQAVNEVTRASSSVLNLDILLPMIVDEISKAFGYYHVQVFLIDELGEWAQLKASTGEIGQELLRRQHRLAVGSNSVIGRVTVGGAPVIALDTDQDAIHRRNELLPNTRAEMAIPLKTGDRVIGALDVQSAFPSAFDNEAQVILQSLADQISVTLENAQLFQEIQDRVAELTTINLVSQAVSRTETMDDLFDVVNIQLTRTFGAQYGFLGIVAENDMIEVPIFIEAGRRAESPPPQPRGTGLAGYVIANRETVMFNDRVEERALALGAKVMGDVTKSLLMVPLMIGDEVIGVISIQSDQENSYDDAHVRQLTTLAAYIAVKIRNAELIQEAEDRAAELGFLFELTRAAVSTTELEESLTSVVEIIQREVKADSTIIYLVDDRGISMKPVAALGLGRERLARGETLAFGEGLPGRAAQDRTSLLVEDARSEPYGLNGGSQTRAAMMVPLTAGQKVVGVIAVESTLPGKFSDGDLSLLETASSTLTAVIENARLLDQIAQANEELKLLDKLRSQFLANMSHELRTPLNSIIGFSKVMLKEITGALNEVQRQDLTTIHDSGRHLLGLINDILDMSKIESGKMEIHAEYVDLEKTIEGVSSTAQGLIKDKPIRLFHEVTPDIPPVFADEQRLRQILLNLVSNAAKFTYEGMITIRARAVSADPVAGKAAHARIDVVDTGIGIAQADMGVLFEAFRQVDGTTTRQVGGTGLGLPITRQFIELHGGTIWVESKIGAGSTFSFTMPFGPPEAAEELLIIDTTSEAGTAPVILAVDDEPRVLELYQRYLEAGGYAMVGLNTAENIVSHVQNVHPAAILLDINMPGRTGWDAMEDLKKLEDTRHIPVVICSINDERGRGFNMGAADYLTKPILEDDLLATLRRVTADIAQEMLSVLVVDADPTYGEAIRDLLDRTGNYQTQVVKVGFEGLQIIDEKRPDVVILDLDLPDMDGYGLLVSIQSHPRTKHVPVIILTGRTLSEEELERLNTETTVYINKRDFSGTLPAERITVTVNNLLKRNGH